MSTFKDHFSGHAQRYAQARPSYPPSLAKRLAELSPRHGLAWDVGCGNGQLSVSLAAHFNRVVATDPSAPQLAQATPVPNVEYRVERAEAPALAAGSVDLVVAAQAAHWFDLPAFYAAVRRVASGPDVLLALASYGLMSIAPEVDQVVGHFYAHTTDPYWAPERALVDSGYRTIAFPFDEVAVAPVEMTKQWSVDETLGYLGTWSAVQKMPVELWHPFERELRAAWGEVPTREVRWPLAIRAGRVGPASQ